MPERPTNKIPASQINDIMSAHQGQADMKVDWVDVPNPDYDPDYDPRRTIKAKQVTWTAKDGYQVVAIDSGETTQTPVRGGEEPGDIESGQQSRAPRQAPEAVVEVVGQGKNVKAESRTPEAQRNDEQLDAERQKNLSATGHWETDKERENREQAENDRARQIQNDEERNRINRSQLEIAQSAESRAAERDAREAANQAAQNEREGRRLTLDEDRYNFDKEKANRPQVISTPTDESAQIAVFNPATGQVEAQANPLYDAAKTAAKRKQEELSLAIQQNKLTADQAAAEYQQWFQRNVQVPFMQAAEKRAQATERRQAMEAQDRRDQFKASFEQDRQKTALSAGQKAADQEIAMLPYAVGPAFGDQMSDAINGLAAGGRLGTDASAGVHFTADAFQYKRPDLQAISKKATKAALKHLTSYDPDQEAYPTADYSGINMPNADVMSTAPAMPSMIDTNQMFQDWQNSRYSGPSQ